MGSLPDLGIQMMRDGMRTDMDFHFSDFRLFNLMVMGGGRYSTFAHMPYGGERYAMSLDFELPHLEAILKRASTPSTQEFRSDLESDPTTPRMIELEEHICFGVRARLGERTVVEGDEFVPFIALEIL